VKKFINGIEIAFDPPVLDSVAIGVNDGSKKSLFAILSG